MKGYEIQELEFSPTPPGVTERKGYVFARWHMGPVCGSMAGFPGQFTMIFECTPTLYRFWHWSVN